MTRHERRSRNRKNRCFSRTLRHEWLEFRSLMAGDILDTPIDPNLDISSGFADVRGALEFKGDVDVFQIDLSDQNSFSGGAWKVEGRDSLQLRVLDASGQEVSDTVADPSGWISLVGTAKGKYSLEVSSTSDEVTEYSIRISAWKTEPPTFPEVNPRPDDADEIGPDATVLDISNGYAWTDGEIVGASDKDVFAFELSKTGPLQIFGSAYRVDNAGFQIALFDASGVQYGQGDSSNLIEISELEAGKYYLVVSDVDGASVGYSFFITSHTRADGTGPDGRDSAGKLPDGGTPDGRDPAGGGPDCGIPEGHWPDGGDPAGKLSKGGTPDGRDPKAPDIRLYLRDGIYFYEDEPRDGDPTIDAIEDPTICPLPGGDWEGDRGAVGDSEGDSEVPGKDGGSSGSSVGMPTKTLARMHNVDCPTDVDGDSHVTPIDALILINFLNRNGAGAALSVASNDLTEGMLPQDNRFLDTNNDGYFSPIDVLIVINQLNRQAAQDLEAAVAVESEADSTDLAFAAAVDWNFSSGEDDEDNHGLLCVLPLPELS